MLQDIPDLTNQLFTAAKKALADKGYTGMTLAAWEAVPDWSRQRRRECVTIEFGEVVFSGEEYAEVPVTVYAQTGAQTDPNRTRLAEIQAAIRVTFAPKRTLLGEDAPPPFQPQTFAARGVADYTRQGVEEINGWSIAADRFTLYISTSTN